MYFYLKGELYMTQLRTSGILLHPTSLPTFYGIGDFGESAYEFVNKLVQSNQSLWQILPLCPIDHTFSPYQSPSAFAGEPLLISPEKLEVLGLLTKEELSHYQVAFQGHTDYTLARKQKEPLFQLAFQRFQENQSKFEIQYLEFQKNQNYWLSSFALFMALKNHLTAIRSNKDFETLKDLNVFIKESEGMLSKETLENYFYSGCWCSFPKSIRNPKEKSIGPWKHKLSQEIEYHTFLQYIFHTQWQELKSFANENHIEIIGDIPIFVAYDSADVWQNQKDFLLNTKGFPLGVAGVPPDYFSPTGQLWGNPLYNWNVQKKSKYSWWLSRINRMLELADSIRLDHFRGFESYWQIPIHAKDAREGQWEQGIGLDFFTSMKQQLGVDTLPIIAEDLGIITENVRQLRRDADLPGMGILQFAFGNDKNNYYLPHCHEKNMVIYTGTHDNNTTKGWYENASDQEKDHYRCYANVTGESPSWDFIRLGFSSCADRTIIPLQDVLELGGDYAMNTPGTIKGNWSFAFSWDMWKDGYTEGLVYLSELFGRNSSSNI